MNRNDIVIKTGHQSYHLLKVNDNSRFFNGDIDKYDIIDFSSLSDYFDVNSNSNKVNIFNCRQLQLRKVKYEEIETSHRVMGDTIEERSLAQVETFDWLVANGVDIRTNNNILIAWARYRENEKLVKYLEALTIPVPNKIPVSIREMIVRNFNELVMEDCITTEQRHSITLFLIEIVRKKEFPLVINETIINSLNTLIKKHIFTSEHMQHVIDFVMEMFQKEISLSMMEKAVSLLNEIIKNSHLSKEQRQSMIDFMMKTALGN